MTTIDTLIDAETIAARVKAMGEEISKDYAGKEVVIVPVLKGSFMFAADLVRHLDIPCRIDFLGLRSYEGESSTGVVQITSDLTRAIENEHVIIVEDIVDTGLTMEYLFENLATRKPASVKLASLLHKPARTNGRHPHRLPRLHHRGRLRDRLRPRLRPAIPEPALPRRGPERGLRWAIPPSVSRCSRR